MTRIICSKNKGYKWTKTKNVFFKGYLQNQSGEVLRGMQAIERLNDIELFPDFVDFLKESYGVYAIIIQHEKELWLASDIAGSIPLFYTDDYRIVSDDVDEIIKFGNEYNQFDELRLFEMYTTSYINFGNTVYRRIKTLNIGCAYRICDGKGEEVPYFTHSSKGASKNDRESDENSLIEIAERTKKMIARLVNVVNGRQIVLSLSGGYDSRYLACSLKEYGVKDVICYTYGGSESFEVKESKNVADALGYRWVNTPYEDDAIQNLLSNANDYVEYSNRPDYIAYLQNYLAVKHLKEQNLIPEDSVIITGLCNDMPTGFYIPSQEQYDSVISKEGIEEYCISQRFIKFNISEDAKGEYKKDIKKYAALMKLPENHDYDSFTSALDCIETASAHTHCFLNMNLVHDFFGYEWLLPCWDKDLLTFWYSQSVDKRINQGLYEKYVTEVLGKKYGVGTKKHIEKLAQSEFARKMKRTVGGLIVKLAYPFGIKIERNTDINNFSSAEVILYKAIKQKRAIKADRAGFVLLLTIYIMEQRYGNEWFKKIKKYLA